MINFLKQSQQQQQQVSSSQKPKSGDEPEADKKNEPLKREVVVQLVEGTLIIKGDKDDVKAVTDIINKIQKKANQPELEGADDQQPDKPSLRSYDLGGADPDTVMSVLQTMLAGRKDLRLSVDPRLDRLVALGRAQEHKTIAELLQKLTPVRAASIDPEPKQPQLQLAFRMIPWADALQWYCEQANLSLVQNEEIPGTLTYSSRRTLTPSGTLDVFNSILLTKGFSLIQRDGALFVVNLEQGVPSELVPRVNRDDLDQHGKYEFVSVLLPLGNLDGDALRQELQPLLGTGGRLVVLPQVKQVVIQDRVKNVREILDLIEKTPARN